MSNIDKVSSEDRIDFSRRTFLVGVSAAGMDLAWVTGRGEPLLAEWLEIDGQLVRDEDAIQLGDREAFTKNYRDIERTVFTRYVIQYVLRAGTDDTARSVIHRLKARGLDRVWVHVDLDVLDQSVMPAVDSPGSPGLTFCPTELIVGATAPSWARGRSYHDHLRSSARSNILYAAL